MEAVSVPKDDRTTPRRREVYRGHLIEVFVFREEGGSFAVVSQVAPPLVSMRKTLRNDPSVLSHSGMLFDVRQRLYVARLTRDDDEPQGECYALLVGRCIEFIELLLGPDSSKDPKPALDI